MTTDSTSTFAATRKVAVNGSVFVGVIGLVVWQHQRLWNLREELAHAHWVWIGAAVLMQGMSVAALARMHRTLLHVAGRRHPIRTILATTYAGNAISQVLPVVGSAASAIFVYRRYLTLGVEKVSAAWVLTLSGLYSTLSFFALTAGGALMIGSAGPAVAGLITLCAGVVPAIALLVGLQHRGIREAVVRILDLVLNLVNRLVHHRDPAATVGGQQIVDQVASLRITRRQALRVGSFALLNWSSDVVCLVFALVAIGAPVPWHGIVLAWAAGAGASSLGLTPGGLGVVESALSLALVAAGLPAVLAIGAVLLYRFITLWLVIAAGAVTLLVIRAKARSAVAVSADSAPCRTRGKAPKGRPLDDRRGGVVSDHPDSRSELLLAWAWTPGPANRVRHPRRCRPRPTQSTEGCPGEPTRPHGCPLPILIPKPN